MFLTFSCRALMLIASQQAYKYSSLPKHTSTQTTPACQTWYLANPSKLHKVTDTTNCCTMQSCRYDLLIHHTKFLIKQSHAIYKVTDKIY